MVSHKNVKRQEEREQPPGFLSECAIFHIEGYKTNSIIKSFSKKTQENEFIWVKLVNPIQGGPFGAAYEGGLKNFLPNIWHTYPTMMKLQWLKKHTNHVTYTLSSVDITYFLSRNR